MPNRRLATCFLTRLVGATLAVGLASPARTVSAQVSARPSNDSAVVAVERGIWENMLRGRWDGVNATLVGALTAEKTGISTWSPAATERLRTGGCVLQRYAMEDVHTRPVTTDVTVLVYRAKLDMQCGGQPAPFPPIYYLSVYRRVGAAWKLEATSITMGDAPK